MRATNASHYICPPPSTVAETKMPNGSVMKKEREFVFSFWIIMMNKSNKADQAAR